MSSAPAISGPWRRRGRAALLFALLDLAAFNAYQVIKSPNPYPDFACFYAVAKAGATLGYSRMYDPAVQQQWVQQMFPGSPCVVVNPPPFAWLLAPLTALPYGLALWIWTVALIAAVVVASQVVAPRDLYLRVVYLASWLAFLPAYLIFISAPLGPLVVLSLALTWKFIRDDRPVLAGAILAVGLLKLDPGSTGAACGGPPADVHRVARGRDRCRRYVAHRAGAGGDHGLRFAVGQPGRGPLLPEVVARAAPRVGRAVAGRGGRDHDRHGANRLGDPLAWGGGHHRGRCHGLGPDQPPHDPGRPAAAADPHLAAGPRPGEHGAGRWAGGGVGRRLAQPDLSRARGRGRGGGAAGRGARGRAEEPER
ncbi:MAG: DUF2029 domain-containing protein [Chloroflexi bacterium]|nr:MAG: DUF2029 domain-containing protein [Chloroflexota bacterium]